VAGNPAMEQACELSCPRRRSIARLQQHEAELKRPGFEHLYLCGSTARDEAREDSDVNLFFDHPEGSPEPHE
jgi:predicted nucleotidyltransferase